MEKRDFCEILESVSKSLALAAVPVFVALAGVAGYVVNGHFEQQKLALQRETEKQQLALEQEKLKQEMFKRAIDVVFSADAGEKMFGRETSVEVRRLYHAHWLNTYNKYADVPISDELIAVVMEQDLVPADGPDAQARPAEAEGSQGWVAVGIFESSHANLNFDVVVPDDYKGLLQKDMVIRARWSVPVRENFDKPGPLNHEIGRLAGGQCAKVVDFNNFVRSQAWAKIDVEPCPAEKSGRLAQLQ